MKYFKIKRISLVLFFLLGPVLVFIATGCVNSPSLKSEEVVVAQFTNGEITSDQLTSYINKLSSKCHTPVMYHHGHQVSTPAQSCHMEHGMTASAMDAAFEQTGEEMGGGCSGEHGEGSTGQCDGNPKSAETQACLEHENCCIQHYNLKSKDYKGVVKAMVLEQMLLEYVKENKIGQEENTQGLIKYVSEKVYIQDTHLSMEESMKPAESDIRKYYEENKEYFGLKTLNEVREEISMNLQNKMHREYMPVFLEELNKNAFINKNLDILTPREPSDYEMLSFYREHRAEYEEPERIIIRQIQTQDIQSAQQAQGKLRAGVDFASVAEKYSEGPFADSGGELASYIIKGDRSDVFEEHVFTLREGDTSSIFEDEGRYFIVQVIERRERRIRELEEVADSVRELLIIENERRLFEDNAQRTLFTVNNRSYTVGEFKEQYDSIPYGARAQFTGLKGKEKLVDLIVEYELLVDDARHKMFDLKNEETVQDITNAILQGSFYETEVVGRIKAEDISSEESMEFYEKNNKDFTKPSRAVLSYIRIPVTAGEGPNALPSEDEIKSAKREAEEAYEMIIGGVEFEEVSRQYSVDEWSSEKLEIIEEKGMPLASAIEQQEHPIHEIVFNMSEGEISKPFEFRYSYFIFKLWEKSEKEYYEFEIVDQGIRQFLVVQKRQELEETLKDDLMERSQLSVNERALKLLAKRLSKRDQKSS
jgi:parvulin-like peptidyl-prolyl isomerase